MIRIEAIWLAIEPLDMRSGPDSCLARVIEVFGEAKPYHAYLFANKRGDRMKVLVHDDCGLWLASRRLHERKVIWSKHVPGDRMKLSQPQLQALLVRLASHQVSGQYARERKNFCVNGDFHCANTRS